MNIDNKEGEIKNENRDARIERAEARTEQAESRTEQAESRTEQAETRTEQAETRTEQAESRTEQAKTRIEKAEMRIEEAEARSDQAIRASELSYRRLFESARDGILILDVDSGRISDVNPFLVELLGFSRPEMVGRTLGELGPFKDIVCNQGVLEHLQADEHVRHREMEMETKYGRHVAVEFVSSVFQTGNKKMIQCNIRDITVRKRAESLLKDSFQEISDLKSALDEHAIVAVTDAQGKITNVNDKFCAISKYSREELIGRDYGVLTSDHHLKEFIRDLWTAITHGRVWHGEIRSKAKDGVFYWVDVTFVPFLDAQGKPRQYVSICTDITARKASEERILSLNAELEQRVAERTGQLQAANVELEAFSHSVSHDLRAPLRHITGFASMLQDNAGASLSEENRRHLTNICRAAIQMGKLIHDLLEFSHAGRLEMQKSEVNLDELARETVGDFQAHTQERNIVWEIGPLPPVWADRALLRLALVNLISNAVKFTGMRAQAKIEIGCAPSRDGETVIFIRDNGAGFDPQYAAKLFCVFQRLHSQEEFEGTGIGLANVQRIIHRHGGRTWAEGVEDGGATFYFSIPNQNGGANGH